MATVVVTFFLITIFYVYKMDADSRKRRRNISQREKRWSMNSQRLEQIVAELMKPISDVRRSFDTDLSALLEEYLTEAGLHALDAEEEEINNAMPNFTELALLLQQSASIYSRKVDFLYQHVLSVSDSLHNSTQDAEPEPDADADGPHTPSSRARKRKPSAHGEFAPLALTPCAAARRDAAPPRPPPTLPRMYVELEPRVLRHDDFPLLDYDGDPVGLLADYLVARRLRRGLLLDELAEGGDDEPAARAPPLAELQAAIAAAAPPSPPPAPSSPPPTTPPPATPPPASPPPSPATLECVLAKRERKRRIDLNLEDIPESPIKLHISKKLRLRLSREQEFSVPARWLRAVLGARRAALLALRRQLRLRPHSPAEFLGFESPDPRDIGGFVGWSRSAEEVHAASAECAATEAALKRVGDSDDDDDGFFEQSSLGDSDTSRGDDAAPAGAAAAAGAAPEWAAWSARVVARAAAAEARGADVARCAAAVLRAAAGGGGGARAWRPLLAAAAGAPADVSRLFLATLFLANAGNVELVPGAPLALDSFGVRVLSTDERLYRSLAEADAQ